MTQKRPAAAKVAQVAALSVGVGYTYEEMDCQAFVEHCVKQAGGQMDYRGSNDMARNAAWLGTVDNARAQGKLVPGAGLLIHGETGEPERYRGDGLGNFSHVGLYLGPDAITDTGRDGLRRGCDAAHSSQTMGRVAGTTLENGWTHVMWFPEIDYGEDVGTGVEAGAEISQGTTNATTGPEEGLTAGTPAMDAARWATVVSPDGNPVKLRKSASARETVYWLVNPGARVQVERVRGGWALIRALCTDGHTRRAYMMEQYLEEENERG